MEKKNGRMWNGWLDSGEACLAFFCKDLRTIGGAEGRRS
jgi:hypothetical protein